MTSKTNCLVIVESPTKAAKIADFLGEGYVVTSSRGHIRDLPTKAADIPAKYKSESWARLGVNVEDKFEPLYVVSPDAKKTIRDLKAKLKDADELILATDGDREGEAIAWHLLEQLKPKIPTKRMVFHEITRSAIAEAVKNTRDIDLDLVDAQETRRILDRLYGYEVSPVLWRKVKPRLSAGRVQSVATRLIVDRERERMAFKSASYCDLEAILDAGDNKNPRNFTARLTAINGVRIAQGKDFNAQGQIRSKELVVLAENSAKSLAEDLKNTKFKVVSVSAKPYTRRPYEPFRTTTLQQEAGRKLGMTAQRVMMTAQNLYEAGFITYMRTDSINLADSAVSAVRAQVNKLYGDDYLPDKPRYYSSKVKNAQEAHEAIRPAGDFLRTPKETGLVGDQYRLYELIWKRTLASQMKDARGNTSSVKIAADIKSSNKEDVKTEFTASGRTISFYGFLKAYVEDRDDDAAHDDDQSRLPELAEGELMKPMQVSADLHHTKPPARYTEPSLVAKLEELEIGRPSTYASIIRTITARDYVFKKGTALVPTWLAFAVTKLLEKHFAKLVDYEFTALMEDALDEISSGELKRLKVLDEFYFGSPDVHTGLSHLVKELGDIDARLISTFEIGGSDSGVVLRVGKYGNYFEDNEGRRANVDDDLPPDALTLADAKELLSRPPAEETVLGVDPETGYSIVAKDGRFGPFVTEILPEDAPKSAKPRAVSLFKSMSLATITFEQALQLIHLPRVVGKDSDGTEITAQNGRYGPYLKKGTDSRSLQTEDQIFDITLEEALAIYAQPKTRGRAASAAPLRELGTDPSSGKPIVVKSGRFGPYVTDGEVNATLRKDDSSELITLERAQELIAEKRAKGPTKKPARASKSKAKNASK